ncbi:polymeric immunoglobulin receptor-like isoform X2 [Mugil cephalus]|uniref:polymeric immunoglobulin receptor-like isoform X2 n=1 Tax=Mugil cephalus TaxID=48193 RepID=UPI001FB6E9C8|nr:polymeric immunoglobulin receptor-like isoform X2 [Mugil cephalus]
MNIHHILLFCFLSALWGGDTGLVSANINVFSGTEGKTSSVICYMSPSGSTKFFCRRECKDGDILIETNQNSSGSDKYSLKYEHRTTGKAFLTVSIMQLTKSDSGRYRCGMGSPLTPNRYVDFDVKVIDVQNTSSSHVKEEIAIHRGSEGKDLRVFCHFSMSKSAKFFCKRKCQEGDILIETTDVRAQSGRYISEYEEGSGQNSVALFVTITQLTASDAGRYRCGLGTPLSPDSFRDFEISLIDASTTSKPSWTHQPFTTPATVSLKATDQLSASTTSKPSLTHQPFTTSATVFPKTTDQLSAFSHEVHHPVYMLPVVICMTSAFLVAVSLLLLYIWKRKRNSSLSTRITLDNMYMTISDTYENLTPAYKQEDSI